MAKINDYYQKKQLMEKLAAELDQLEKDQALKSELDFEKDVRALMKKYDKSPKHVLQVLAAIDPSVAGAKGDTSTGTRAKRPMKTYKNPHTGEGRWLFNDPRVILLSRDFAHSLSRHTTLHPPAATTAYNSLARHLIAQCPC